VTVFGQIVSFSQVQALAYGKLRLWLPTYLREVERQTGRAACSLGDVLSWGAPTADFEKRPEQQLPILSIVSPGTSTAPALTGTAYRAPWRLEVRVVVAAGNEVDADSMAKDYAAAVMALMVQQKLGAPVQDVVWTGDEYDDLGRDSGRRLMVGANVGFDVYVGDVVDKRRGPSGEPPDDPCTAGPLPEGPTVETVFPRVTADNDF
jgi:hypothetical protein